MKKIYILAFAISAFSFSSYAQVDQTDDFESYNLGTISAQSDLWKTWSGDEGGAEDALVSSNQAQSGSKALMIDNVGAPSGKDQLYIIESQPDGGLYTVRFNLYVPSGNEGYFNLQGDTPPIDQGSGSFLSPDIYFNKGGLTPGQGQMGATGTIVWSFPHDAWFQVEVIVDLDDKTLQLNVDGSEAIPAGTPFSDIAVPYLGAIDFYAPGAFTTYYVDDIVTGFGILGLNDLKANAFSVYPNPVKDVLNIQSKASVDNVTIYDILGKVVLQENPGKISPAINMSSLATGSYLVKVTIGNSSKTVKVLK